MRKALFAWSIGLVAVGLAIGGLTLYTGLWRVPDRHNPWAPLSLAEPTNWLTGWKLKRLNGDPALCRHVLGETRWKFAAVPDRETGEGCGFNNAVRIERMRFAVGPPFTLSCPAAVSLALWEQEVVLPAARRHFGRGVERLEHFGSYSCRNVYGREAGTRSRHATANAFDVAGFVIDGGRRITVARHWTGDSPEALFLRDLHRGGCRWFDVVLGPDYNAAHADHLHLDRGPLSFCR